MTVIGLISNKNESTYGEQIKNLETWNQTWNKNLALNSKKTKELILDFRKQKHSVYLIISIEGEKVEVVNSFKFLHISNSLSTAMAKKVNIGFIS